MNHRLFLIYHYHILLNSPFTIHFILLLSVDLTYTVEFEDELRALPETYVKTMLRLTISEIKCRLVADNPPIVPPNPSTSSSSSSTMSTSSTPSATTAIPHTGGGGVQERVLCCLFTNNVVFTLKKGDQWWDVGCTVTNLALKDYTSEHHKLKYLLKRSDDYYSSMF